MVIPPQDLVPQALTYGHCVPLSITGREAIEWASRATFIAAPGLLAGLPAPRLFSHSDRLVVHFRQPFPLGFLMRHPQLAHFVSCGSEELLTARAGTPPVRVGVLVWSHDDVSPGQVEVGHGSTGSRVFSPTAFRRSSAFCIRTVFSTWRASDSLSSLLDSISRPTMRLTNRCRSSRV